MLKITGNIMFNYVLCLDLSILIMSHHFCKCYEGKRRLQSCHTHLTANLSPFNLFSSPELKAQVSFSDHLSSVVCLSVRPSVRLSVSLSVNFSHFHLLLLNHWANFNRTWNRAFLGEGDFKFVQMKDHALPKGEIIGK